MLIRLTLLAVLTTLQATPRPAYFTAPGPPDAMRGKQAVLDTSEGTIVLQLLPDAAPNQVGLFMKLAADGAYAGTLFHRVVPNGIIQGGDPLTRDPARRAAYGSGGFNQVRDESNDEKLTPGAVAAVRVPNQRDSAGSQFFICVSSQPRLDGQHTVFARVVEGIEVVQAISNASSDAGGHPDKRYELRSVTIRDTPVDPFVNATPAELAAHRAVIETTMGSIELALLPDKAPETVRSFLQWAAAGVYDGIKVHRVASNFVIQTGALAFRATPLTAAQQRLIHNLPPEFTNTPNEPGIVSIARAEDPRSGSTSFFICIGDCRQLDGKYTVFARVVGGMNVVNAMSNVSVDGERPRLDIVVRRVRVE